MTIIRLARAVVEAAREVEEDRSAHIIDAEDGVELLDDLPRPSESEAPPLDAPPCPGCGRPAGIAHAYGCAVLKP